MTKVNCPRLDCYWNGEELTITGMMHICYKDVIDLRYASFLGIDNSGCDDFETRVKHFSDDKK